MVRVADVTDPLPEEPRKALCGRATTGLMIATHPSSRQDHFMRRNVTLTIAALGLTLTAACGGGGDRPTSSELSKALTANNNATGTTLPKKQADCFAKLLEKSGVSDKTLRALVAGDKKYKGTKKDETALGKVATKAATSCI
jgi:hypothetical protein